MLGDWAFRVNPTSVEWDFRVKTSSKPMLGGKVVQVIGVNFGDMRVSGSFGRGRFDEQADFLAWAKRATRQQEGFDVAAPLRFTFRHWDFDVLITNYSEGQYSVDRSVANFAPRFNLTLQIVKDRGGLRHVAKDIYVQRISRGFGWEQTEYNGPLSINEVEQALGGRSIDEFLGLIDPEALAEFYNSGRSTGGGMVGAGFGVGGTSPGLQEE